MTATSGVHAASTTAALTTVTSLADRATKLNLVLEVQFVDGRRAQITGADLQTYLSDGARLQRDLNMQPSAFARLVELSVQRNTPNLHLHLHLHLHLRVRAPAMGAAPAGGGKNIAIISEGNKANTEGLNAPAATGANRTASAPPSGGPGNTGVFSPVVAALRGKEMVGGNVVLSHEKRADRARAMLLLGGTKLQRLIGAPVPRTTAEQRLREILNSTTKGQLPPAKLAQWVAAIYDESINFYADPSAAAAYASKTADDRRATFASFMRGMPAGTSAETMTQLAKRLDHPVLAHVPPWVLQQRLNQIAANGYQTADITQFSADIAAIVARISFLSSGVDHRDQRLPAEPLKAADANLATGVILGGKKREFVLFVHDHTHGTVRDNSLGWIANPELNNHIDAYVDNRPSDRTSAEHYAAAASNVKIELGDFAALRLAAELAVADSKTSWFRKLFQHFGEGVITPENTSNLNKLRDRGKETRAILQKKNDDARDQMDADMQKDKADIARLPQAIARERALDRLLAIAGVPPHVR